MNSLWSLCVDTFVISQGFNLDDPIFWVLEELTLHDATHAQIFDLDDFSRLGHFHSSMLALKTFRFVAPNWLDPTQRITGLRQKVDLQANQVLLALGRLIADLRVMGMVMLERFVVCGIPDTVNARET